MSIELNIETQPGYLIGRAAGPFELEEAKALTEKLLRTAVARQQVKVLLDIHRITGPVRDTYRFLYTEFVAHQVVKLSRLAGGPIRLAFVGREPVIDPERFGVTVAYNRAVRIIVTDSEAEALAWLGVA